jgi:CRP-like cAMP-binding protein
MMIVSQRNFFFSNVKRTHVFLIDTLVLLSPLLLSPGSASLCAASAIELITIPLLLFNVSGIREALEKVHQDKERALIMSNVFNGLPKKFLKDGTDFANIRIFEQGDVIIRQGQHSESLFILLQGVCKVSQKIDIREELVHRRKQLIDTLEGLKTKYIYHHQLIYHSASRPEERCDAFDDTLYEKKMTDLEAELSILIAQIKEIDRQKMAHFRRKSKNRWKNMGGGGGGLSVDTVVEKRKKVINDQKKIEKIHLGEIMTPSFFGEQSLRGDGSLEHAEVTASTRVVVLRIFMSQMDFSKVNDQFLNRLTNLSAVKPLSLTELSARAKGERGWDNYRKTLMTFINKMKWPVRNAHVKPGPCGTSIIHELQKEIAL